MALPLLATAAYGCGVFGAFDFDGYEVAGAQDAAVTSSRCDSYGRLQQVTFRRPTVGLPTSEQPAACKWSNGQGAAAPGDQSYASFAATAACGWLTESLALKGFGLQLPPDAQGVTLGIEATVRAVGADGKLSWKIGVDPRAYGDDVASFVPSSGGAWQVIAQQNGDGSWGIPVDSEPAGFASIVADPEFVVTVAASAWDSRSPADVEVDIDSVQIVVSYQLPCVPGGSSDELDASAAADEGLSDAAEPER